MTRPTYLDAALVPKHLRGTYTGTKFQAVVTEKVTIPLTAGLSDGGTREIWTLIRMSDGKEVEAVNHNAPPDRSRRDVTIHLEPGFAAVRRSWFCGKDMGLTFHIHPRNAADLVPLSTADLHPVEQLVLIYTACRKSSYMGKNRYQMAVADITHGYPEDRAWDRDNKVPPSEADWEMAKASLIGFGYLNRAGAVTPAGRNAAQNLRRPS
jgi:hypothetical protein